MSLMFAVVRIAVVAAALWVASVLVPGIDIAGGSMGLLIAELVARHALRHLIGDRVRIEIERNGRAFELRVGPLEEGGGDAVVASSEVPVVGPVVERLANEVRVEHRDDAEHLVVRIARND